MSFQVDIPICACFLGLGHFHLEGANLQIQTHLEPKIMHQNLAIILQHFNYSKNSFIALLPECRLNDDDDAVEVVRLD